MQQIRAAVPSAQIEFVPLDLSALASVEQFAAQMLDCLPSLDILVNCAGIGGFAIGWTRRETVDGPERTFATNYLGHFALTGRLLPVLLAAPNARVICVSSLAHWSGRINFDDLQSVRRFQPTAAYDQSKLAMLLFALELHRRARAAGLGLLSIPIHPGIAHTDIFQRTLSPSSLRFRLSAFVMRLVAQPAARVPSRSSSPRPRRRRRAARTTDRTACSRSRGTRPSRAWPATLAIRRWRLGSGRSPSA